MPCKNEAYLGMSVGLDSAKVELFPTSGITPSFLTIAFNPPVLELSGNDETLSKQR